MTKVTWKSGPRSVPGVGTVAKGDTFSIPDHLARSLIGAGLASKPKTSKTPKPRTPARDKTKTKKKPPSTGEE